MFGNALAEKQQLHRDRGSVPFPHKNKWPRFVAGKDWPANQDLTLGSWSFSSRRAGLNKPRSFEIRAHHSKPKRLPFAHMLPVGYRRLCTCDMHWRHSRPRARKYTYVCAPDMLETGSSKSEISRGKYFPTRYKSTCTQTGSSRSVFWGQ